MDAVFWDHEGPQRAKGRFNNYEVAALCIVLLIVQCLREGGAFIQFLWPTSLGHLGGGKNQDRPSVLAAKVAHGACAWREYSPYVDRATS